VHDDEIRKLIDGFGRFRARHFATDDGLYRRLFREGQAPKVMVIACCDARVDPAIITDCDPGELFVVRNVANLVPPHETLGHYHGTSAALEFAVRVLKVRHIVVLGHSRCGGIGTLLSDLQGEDGLGQFIAPWMNIAAEARSAAQSVAATESPDAVARVAEQSAIRISLRNLLSFPWVRQRIDADMLRLHGWYFNMDQGELLHYEPEQNRYLLLR
jgi:carbonic anhydrase